MSGEINTKDDYKPTIDISQLPPKQAAFALLKETGLTNTDAAKVLGYSNGTARVISSKINKLSLTHPKMVKSAARVIKDVLDLKPIEIERTSVTKSGQVVEYTDNIYPTHTNALTAAAMVYDRVEPAIKQTANLNINCDISPVDLEAYRR
jgi:hypothetical protein